MLVWREQRLADAEWRHSLFPSAAVSW